MASECSSDRGYNNFQYGTKQRTSLRHTTNSNSTSMVGLFVKLTHKLSDEEKSLLIMVAELKYPDEDLGGRQLPQVLSKLNNGIFKERNHDFLEFLQYCLYEVNPHKLNLLSDIRFDSSPPEYEETDSSDDTIDGLNRVHKTRHSMSSAQRKRDRRTHAQCRDDVNSSDVMTQVKEAVAIMGALSIPPSMNMSLENVDIAHNSDTNADVTTHDLPSEQVESADVGNDVTADVDTDVTTEITGAAESGDTGETQEVSKAPDIAENTETSAETTDDQPSTNTNKHKKKGKIASFLSKLSSKKDK